MTIDWGVLVVIATGFVAWLPAAGVVLYRRLRRQARRRRQRHRAAELALLREQLIENMTKRRGPSNALWPRVGSRRDAGNPRSSSPALMPRPAGPGLLEQLGALERKSRALTAAVASDERAAVADLSRQLADHLSHLHETYAPNLREKIGGPA